VLGLLQGGTFIVKPVGERDAAAILEVYRQCEDFLSLGPAPNASMDMVRADLEHSRSVGGIYCGIYAATGCMVGAVDYVPQMTGADSDKAFLNLLMIAKAYRSKGIGRQVVELVEEEITKNKSIKQIHSGVQVNNPGAIRFWKSMAYEIRSGPELLPDGTTVYHLAKRTRPRPSTSTQRSWASSRKRMCPLGSSDG